MQYYKIIKDDEFVGVITSNNFIYYDTITNSYMRTTEDYGELVEYKGKFYRTSWMLPVGGEFSYNYTNVSIFPITAEEYNTLKIAVENHEEIPAFEEEEEIPDPINLSELEYVRSGKLIEMSAMCNTTIERGFDLIIHNESKHFSLTTQDQLNLMSLNLLAASQELIPYHADGEPYTFYTAQEIIQIVNAANAFKTYHTTYYNALKLYINSLQTIEEIGQVTYGMEIPEEYKTNVLKVLEIGN